MTTAGCTRLKRLWLILTWCALGIGWLAAWLTSQASATDSASAARAPVRGLAWIPSRAASLLGDGGPWVVRAYYTDRQQVRDLAAWIEPWEVIEPAGIDDEHGYVVVAVTRGEAEHLVELGFRLEIVEPLTAQLNQPNAFLPGQSAGIPGYPCYRTVEETYEAAEALAATYPHLATWTDIGDSWEKTQNSAQGYDLMILRLTHSAIPGPKPKLFIMAALHAREYAPTELALRFAEHLVVQYGLDPDVTWLLDYHEIHFLLQANPDGRQKAETGLFWRKNTNNSYCADTHSRGADLNRNYEFQWGCCGGSSSNPCSETYRGAAPASEPETIAVQDYLRTLYPDQRGNDVAAAAPITSTGIFVDLHSYGEMVLWPWGYSEALAPNGLALQTLGRKLSYLNGYWPSQSWELYPTEGTTDGFAYGELGLAAYTLEVGTAFFQDCTAFEDIVLPNNLPALVYAAKAARQPYLVPAGPDTLDVTSLPGTVEISGTARLTAVLDDTRYNGENGSEPVRPVASAEYYLDVPPWIATGTPTAYAMTAADGAFDEPIEEVSATIHTAGLSAGRHILYVRGCDADGNWGAISAAFLDSYDPDEITLEPRLFLPSVRRGS